MSSPTSPAQKNLSEEDSSGSEAGLETCLEPETDRFGFILSNGSTAGSVGPPPELVRQREIKWINIISQWDRMLLKKTSKVKVQCQKGIPASLRAKCWPLLCGATDKLKQNEDLYKSLDSQPALQSWRDIIERDLDRQFPFHEMFLSKDGHGQRGLFRVLKAYTQYQPEEGYCQAQGPVAAVLLMNMPAEEAFWCLVQISEQYLPGYYSPLLEGVLFDAAMLTWVLKRTCPAVHKHLQHHGVEPLMFATDWLMCLFTRHLPFNTLLRVWDLFFCYGVRVLLQVAVVLVRRALGRTEQRKQCQGQMETLERLRGVREQVQEEDDTFIAEVCSVQLSDRDLEKQTEKELGKWRKDRPSSTFDPRGRCQGYRMAWTRARQNEEERHRKEREKGNLTVPLVRSASTLSLSPSLLQKRWGKGAKANKHEWEAGRRVVRHSSMGANEDRRSWTGLHFKKVQGVQEEEDTFLEEHKNQNELKITGQTEQKEFLEEPKKMEIQNMPTKHVEEMVIIEEQVEQVETRITEKEERQLKEMEEQMEEIKVETEQTKGPAVDQAVENIPHPAKHKQELDSNGQSHILEQQSHLKIEVKDTNKETENQVEQNKHTTAVKVNQAEEQKDADTDKNTEVEMQECVYPSEEQTIRESTETENVQQTQVDPVTAETSPGSETDSQVEASAVKYPTIETETQQQQPEVITETDGSSQGDALDGKYHSTESLAETDTKEESHTQTEAETDELPPTQEKVKEDATTEEFEAEKVKTDSKTKAETLILCSTECIQLKEGIDLVADTEAEIPVANDTVTESSEAFEKECDAVAPEPTEQGERPLTEHSEAQVDTDHTQAEETPTGSQMNETTDAMTPPQMQMISTQDEAVTLTTPESDGKTSSVETSTSEERVPEQPSKLVIMDAVEEEESTETVQENTEGGEVEPTVSPNTDSNPQLQDKDSHISTDQTESDNSGLTQASGHRSIQSSGDVCIRKSSNSHGSRLARRLSEDLFTMPEKTSRIQFTPNQVDSQSNPGDVNTTQSPPDVTSGVTSSLSAEVSERTAVKEEQQPPDPPKRFGLFKRLRGEQPKKAQRVPKMQVPKILIQDFSDGTGVGKPIEEEREERLSSRERRRVRRERERREKEEEMLRKKREKEMGKEKERERRKLQARGKSSQVQREKVSSDVTESAKTGSQMCKSSASYAESYF